MTTLLTIWAVFKSALSKALGVITANPWPCALAASLLLSLWLYSGKQDALQARDKARTALATEKTARATEQASWRRQVASAKAATAAAERKSQEIASHAQASHDSLAADNAGLRAYIAARRMRGGGGPVATASASQDHSAQLPADTASAALVAADEADLVTCDNAYVYAVSAYEWARELIAGGLASAERAKP